MSTTVTPVVTFEDTPEAILDYLARRTDDTIGDLVDRSGAVVVGVVTGSEHRSVPVSSEDADALQPWITEEQPGKPHLELQVSTVHVERWLTGSNRSDHLEIIYANRVSKVTGEPDSIPFINEGQRGLLCLRAVSGDVPYARYLPDAAYQLAQGEDGVRAFQVADYDDQGEPLVRDEAARVNETIEAVEWYTAHDRGDNAEIRQSLIDALDSPNPRIVRHAIRALARQGDPAAAEHISARLSGATDDRAVRLMLGLWVLGERDRAVQALQNLLRTQGKHQWLAGWGIDRTQGENNESVSTLYGPDPSSSKGD